MILFPAPDIHLDPVSAVLEGFIFGAPDDFGTRWTLAESDGWFGSPAMRDLGPDRPNSHGNFATTGLKTGRSITMTGLGMGVSQASVSRSVRVMRALLGDGGFGGLTFMDQDVPLVAQVQRDGEVQVRWLSDRTVQYQLSLFAPDPRVYGEPVTISTGLPGGGTGLSFPIGDFFDFGDPGSTGQVSVSNDGTASTEPQFTVSGPLAAGFQITETDTGRRLRYESPVSADVVIDCAEGTATSGGQDRSGLLTVDEFFSIPSLASRAYQFSTLGAETADDPARMTINVSPAYH